MLFVLLLCVLAGAGGLSSDEAAPSRPSSPVAVKIRSPKYEYKVLVHSVKDIDFKNFQYHLFGQWVRLRSGSMKGTEPLLKGEELPIHIEVSLRHVRYFDFQEGEPRHALISLDFFSVGASSSDQGFILLFELINGHPVVRQQFEYDRQAPEAEDTFDAKLGLLTIKARAQDASPHCCPENLETDEFAWQGQEFRLRNRKIQKLPPSNN